MAYLRHYLNGTTVVAYELEHTLTIGRQLDCTIVIDDPAVSGRHAQLCLDHGLYQLVDLESNNGVRIKWRLIEGARALSAGDIFAIGTHEFEYLTDLPTDLDKTLKIKKSWIPRVYFTV
ncbi:MAG: pSer/pThr/pTyr-binding forkhead associated (FHA) protein [Lentisphaeria bacterium]|jgi:pSer/pThr/pTyr-binding forkhead associated (FHA) protein